MSTPERTLLEKLKGLPPQRLAEVEDFVDFLRSREIDTQLARTATKVSEPAFGLVWENADDAEYDRL
jgi:hypothetical protein